MHDWKAEDWVRFSSTSVSLVFTSAFLIKSLIHRNFRPFSRLVTTLLIWSNWVQSVSNMVSLFITKYNSTYTECVATGILRQVGNWAALVWSLVLTVNVYVLVHTAHDLGRYGKQVQIASWAAVLLFTVLPFAEEGYGRPPGKWCWLATPQTQQIFYYVPLYIVVVAIVGMFAKTMLTVYQVHARVVVLQRMPTQTKDNRRTQIVRMVLKKLLWFPLIFIIAWTLPMIRRMIELTSGSAPMWARIGHAASVPMQGTLNTILFHRRTVRAALFATCGPVCCCDPPKDSKYSTNTSGRRASLSTPWELRSRTDRSSFSASPPASDSSSTLSSARGGRTALEFGSRRIHEENGTL